MGSNGGIFTDLVPVVSSNLAAAGWGEHNGESILEVEFLSGSLYMYIHVPKSVYNDLMAAPSKGKFFWKNIRCKTTDCSGADIPYPYYKVR